MTAAPMTDRERLAKMLYENYWTGLLDTPWSHLGNSGRGFWLEKADWFLDRGVTLPPEPPPPPKVWPGLEEADAAYAKAYMQLRCLDGQEESRRAGLAAAAPVLWRAMVKSMPDAYISSVYVNVRGTILPRADLLAIADPYDGGGT